MTFQPQARDLEPAPIRPAVTVPPRKASPARLVRCSCGRCGAHVIAHQRHTLGGNCNNCGSYELRPLAPERP